MEVSEKILQRALKGRINKECCSVSNVFAYSNESDFLSISYDGIATEVEIKISRSDFKADFKKDKHKAYKAFIKGLSYYVTCWDVKGLSCDYSFRYREIITSRIGWYKKSEIKCIDGKHYTIEPVPEWNKRHGLKTAPTSCINISPIRLPNKFYYLVPEELIKTDEVPEYAGLMYYHGKSRDPMKRISIVKNAKTMHKDKFKNWESIARRLFNINQNRHVQSELFI